MSAAPIEPDPFNLRGERPARPSFRAPGLEIATDVEETPRRRVFNFDGLRALQKKGVFRSSTFVFIEVVATLVAVALCGVAMTWWVLSQGPVEVPAIREAVASELSSAREGRPVAIDRVELAWTAQRGLELRAADVVLKDRSGAALSTSREVSIGISPRHLLIGQIRLTRANFTGGDMTVERRRDGAVALAFGPPGSEADLLLPAPASDETIMQRVNRVLDSMARALRPVGPGGRLWLLSVSDAHLVVHDEASGARWSADQASFELRRDRNVLSLRAQARLEGPRGPAPAAIALTTDTAFSGARVHFTATGVRPSAILSPAALGIFANLNSPMNAALDIGLDRRRGVTRFEGEVALGRGGAQMEGGRFSIDGGQLHGRYDPASDVLTIDRIALAGAKNRIGGRIELRNASALVHDEGGAPATFTAALPSVVLDVPGVFPEAASLSNVMVEGRYDTAARTLDFSRIQTRIGEAQLNATGRIYWAAATNGAVHPGAALEGRITGRLQARDIVRLWPLGTLAQTRAYLGESVEGGVLTDVSLHLDIKPDDVAAGVLRDEAMRIAWNFNDARFRYINTMSPLVGARGNAVLQGNRLDIAVADGFVEGLRIADGKIELPQFIPRGAIATISARATGDARGAVKLLTQAPLSLGDSLPMQPDTVVGRSVIALTIQRPMRPDVTAQDIKFNVAGQFEGVGGLERQRRVTFADGRLNVRGDERAVTISGPLRVGASTTHLEWVETLTQGARTPSRYSIAGDFDAADLTRLGYPIGQVASGRVGVTVRGAGRGYQVDSAQVQLEMRNAIVALPWRVWTKPVGQPGSARFNVARAADGGLVISNIDLRGPGLAAQQGEARISRRDEFVSAVFPRFVIANRSDARLRVDRSGDGSLSVDVTGAFLDATPWMEDDGGAADRRAAAAATPGAPAPQRSTVRAQARVERLGMRGGAALSRAQVNLAVINDALVSLSAEGTDSSNGAFTMSLGPRPNDPQSRILVNAPDAGFAVLALTGADNVRGGTGRAEGTWTPGPPARAQFVVKLKDFRAVRVPAMTRLLSSVASLRGMGEMLGSDGISFSELEAPATMAGGVVTIGEARMVGPTLGLTATGSYDMRRDNLDIDGVAAPSYGLNSVLGNVPVLGDLFVSREGEGMFGITYSMNGPLANARVGVNPLSAFTPGIFRRIFEPTSRNPAPRPAPRGATSPRGAPGAPRAPAAPPAPAPEAAN
ncbi:MAG: hypothetical protein JNJ73_12505 [Hyphomonadaceae bacterium]|nr:hypothetical protein [Hyphomonadaceae bacterium]